MPRETYKRREVELLAVDCWCRCARVRVPADEVRAGRTFSCGRRLCDALGFTSALADDGEPCQCDERAQTG